jgi:Tat protein translocase TatC
MREVRMTFGEHLEDLRRRILYCLLYLFAGVAISMIFGKDLLEWVLVPHYTAIRTESRVRLTRHMEKDLRRLGVLASVRPIEPAAGDKPLLAKPPTVEDWTAVFAQDLAHARLAGRLEKPFEQLSGSVGSLGSLVPEDRTRLAADVKALGAELSNLLAAEFSPSVGSGRRGGVVERFQRLRDEMASRRVNSTTGAVGRLVGWEGDIDTVLQLIDQFLIVLEGRKKQVLASPVDLDTLHTWTRSSDLPVVLDDVLDTLEKAARDISDEKTPAIMVTSYLESFMAYLKVAFVFAIFLTLPFMLYELWKFVGAGLYPNEQKYVVTLLPFSLMLFVMGCLFGYFAMIPVGLKFLAGWGIEEVNLSFTLENYIGLFLTLTLVLGLVFQTPLIMVFLTKINILNVNAFRRARKMAIFVGVCLAVVLTPPDPFSWSLMAGPMIILYEIGIWICKLFEPRSNVKEPVSELVGAGPPQDSYRK